MEAAIMNSNHETVQRPHRTDGCMKYINEGDARSEFATDGGERQSSHSNRENWLTKAEWTDLTVYLAGTFMMTVGLNLVDTAASPFAPHLYYGGPALIVSYAFARFTGVFDDD